MVMQDTKAYIEASIEIPSHLVDAVVYFITENISSGILYEDNIKTDTVLVKFYVPSEDDHGFREKLLYYFTSLKELEDYSGFEPDIKERIVENVEWEDVYKESVKSIMICSDVVVRPPWDEKPVEALFDIVIEPKMAFGTGSHETTRSCLKIIRETFQKGTTFLDIGCGSGILSILADQIGASYIKAIDYDQISVENTIENYALNNVTTNHEVLHGSIELAEDDLAYDFVCANIIKSAILPMLDRLNQLTKKGGYLILSGLLDDDVSEIEENLLKLGLNDYTILKDNEWRSFTIHKSQS